MVKEPPKIDPHAPIIEMTDVAIARQQAAGLLEVEQVNWRVSAGTFWVIGGLFGSGKSDFLATATGLQRPARGVVKLFGHETFTIKEELLIEHRRRIGLVFANGGRLFNRLTIAENIALPIRYHQNWREDEAEESVGEILELTGLTRWAHHIPSGLSPSWQQRASLARALSLKPEILLLDKPLVGMDVRHQRWWLEFLKNLSDGISFYQKKPVTIVATAESFEPWKDVAHQFALLRNNQWQELGGAAELAASSEPLLREVWTEDI